MYPWGLQVLVAGHVRDILAKTDGDQRAGGARRAWWLRNLGLPRGADRSAGLEPPTQTPIRGSRSVPHRACGVCWLLDVADGPHGQNRRQRPRLLTSHGEVEWRTDRLADAPWRALGPARAQRLAELTGPILGAAFASGLLPAQSTLGIATVRAPGPRP